MSSLWVTMLEKGHSQKLGWDDPFVEFDLVPVFREEPEGGKQEDVLKKEPAIERNQESQEKTKETPKESNDTKERPSSENGKKTHSTLWEEMLEKEKLSEKAWTDDIDYVPSLRENAPEIEDLANVPKTLEINPDNPPENVDIANVPMTLEIKPADDGQRAVANGTGDIKETPTSDITVIHEDVSPPVKQYILKLIRHLVAQRTPEERSQLAVDIKYNLESSYGPTWHVIITDQSLWMAISCLTNYSFQFRMGEFNYLLWSTPI